MGTHVSDTIRPSPVAWEEVAVPISEQQTRTSVPPSMGFSRQEYWSGPPFPSPEVLPDPGIEPGSPVLQADALPSEPPGKLFLPQTPLPSRLPHDIEQSSMSYTLGNIVCFCL